MTIAIVGSRTVPETQEQLNIISDYIASKVDTNEITCVVSGGAEGVDAIGYKFAKRYEIEEYREFIPRWGKYPGFSAAFYRNKRIILASDVVFVFWDGNPASKGTKINMDLCKEHCRRHYIYNYKEEKEKNEKEKSGREKLYPTRKAKV